MPDREPVEIVPFGRSMHLLRCSVRWDEMTPTADPLVRRCNQCATDVHRIAGADDFQPSARCINLFADGLEFSGAPL